MNEEKRRIYAWAMYDWANSAFATTVMAGFFPLFFKAYYSADADATLSTAQLGLANSLSGIIIALLAPLLGAIADCGGYRKRFLFTFAYLGILMTAALAMVDKGSWQLAALIYAAGAIGFMGSNIFYDALLPSVARKDSVDRVSGLGFALGYLGGGVLFALNVAMVQQPAFFGFENSESAVKASFLSVALWWALFSLPLLLFVEEAAPRDQEPLAASLRRGSQRFIATLKKVRALKGIALFLAAYWLYIDGVDTIIRMAVDYGMALGFDSGDLIVALLIVQFAGFPATLLFARLAEAWETKKALLAAIGFYLLITLWASLMQETWEFFVLALMIACVQGGIQALSRSYYARMIPPEASAEFFGFYNMLGKFAAIFGPALVGGVALLSGSSRLGIASVALFFIAGALLLWRVRAKEVRAQTDRAVTPDAT